MAVNDCKWLQIAFFLNGWTLVERARDSWKWLDMGGNG